MDADRTASPSPLCDVTHPGEKCPGPPAVAALFVEAGGAYFGLPDVDPSVDEEVRALLGPDTFSPRAVNPDGEEYA